MILCLAHFRYELDFDMDILSFWKCIESSIQDITELAPYLPVGKVSEQKQNIFKIKMFSLFTELKLEEVKKNKKFCIAHFHSRIFIRWLEIIQDQMWVPHLVWLWGDLWNFVFSHITLISDLLVTRVKTHQLKLIDLFLQLQEKKKSDKRDNLIT